MKIMKLLQRLIDKNYKYLIDNKNNIFSYYCDGYHDIQYKRDDLTVNGKNNKIIFIQPNPSAFMPSGLSIRIKGNNNLIIIEEPRFTNSSIEINGDNTLFDLKKTINICNGVHVFLDHGGKIIIDKNCELGNGDLLIIVNGDYDKSHGLYIGEGTHIAREAIIRTSDGECLLNNDGKPISEPKDVIIGKHCWITSRCTILKGTILPNGTIVAANSLVNKCLTEERTLIGGVPARVLKQNVSWHKGSYRLNMQEYIGAESNVENIDWDKYLQKVYGIKHLKMHTKRREEKRREISLFVRNSLAT